MYKVQPPIASLIPPLSLPTLLLPDLYIPIPIPYTVYIKEKGLTRLSFVDNLARPLTVYIVIIHLYSAIFILLYL